MVPVSRHVLLHFKRWRGIGCWRRFAGSGRLGLISASREIEEAAPARIMNTASRL
jgi:16S rRNA G966 N2-methylase RsmD